MRKCESIESTDPRPSARVLRGRPTTRTGQAITQAAAHALISGELRTRCQRADAVSKLLCTPVQVAAIYKAIATLSGDAAEPLASTQSVLRENTTITQEWAG